MLDVPLAQRMVDTGEVRLHVVEAGPADGPLVLLLHGFPEFWYGWRRQIPALARAGFRVWAPDQRGYNTSDKPRRVADYAIDRLTADVVALIDAAGRERAFLVGHDWGGGVAWHVAQQHPERVARLVVLNCPHGAVMLRHLRRPRQLFRSWYIFAMQLPWLPERMALAGGGRPLARALRRTSRPGSFQEEDLALYCRAWSQKGAMRSMIHWYRALVRRRPRLPADPRVRVPTLLLWGVHDVALSREMAAPSIALCDDGRLVTFDDATHWVQHDAAEEVNRLIVEFLGG